MEHFTEDSVIETKDLLSQLEKWLDLSVVPVISAKGEYPISKEVFSK